MCQPWDHRLGCAVRRRRALQHPVQLQPQRQLNRQPVLNRQLSRQVRLRGHEKALWGRTLGRSESPRRQLSQQSATPRRQLSRQPAVPQGPPRGWPLVWAEAWVCLGLFCYPLGPCAGSQDQRSYLMRCCEQLQEGCPRGPRGCPGRAKACREHGCIHRLEPDRGRGAAMARPLRSLHRSLATQSCDCDAKSDRRGHR